MKRQDANTIEKILFNRAQKRRLFHEQKMEPDCHKLNNRRILGSMERNNKIAKTERSGNS